MFFIAYHVPDFGKTLNLLNTQIPVILYHGSQQEREKMRRKMFSLKRKSNEVYTHTTTHSMLHTCIEVSWMVVYTVEPL